LATVPPPPVLGDLYPQYEQNSPKTQEDRARRSGDLRVLAVAGGLGAAPANTLGAFLVASAVDAGMAEGAAGLLFAAGAVTGLAARVAGGVVTDRMGRSDALPTVGWMLAGGALGFGLLAAHTTTLAVPGTLLAYGLGWGWPGLFNLSVVSRHAEAPAAATGVTQTGIYLGAVTGPLVFGVLADHLGFAWGWAFSLAATLTAAVTVSAVARRRPVAELGLETGT
ncbi:MAG TPA: MFS transporter, partial [Acidimicrobiia bacterium]|nr:MFS transporter [Acidimicrobiia bacterium]